MAYATKISQLLLESNCHRWSLHGIWRFVTQSYKWTVQHTTSRVPCTKVLSQKIQNF